MSMDAYKVREAQDQDVMAMLAWLPTGAEQALPAADGGERWLVAVPADGGLPVASLRVRRCVGLERPRFWYHVGCRVHAAAELGLYQRQRTLLLGNDHTGAAELADLGVDMERLATGSQGAALALLLHSALQWLAQPAAAGRSPATRVITELPGVRDGAGRSPFWDGLGRHFFPGDAQQALRRLGAVWRSQVAALLPRQAVYVSFLPQPAQEAIGQVAASASGWAEALLAAGFRPGQHVAIDDGGPVYELDWPPVRPGGVGP